jgi:hypothetical protein
VRSAAAVKAGTNPARTPASPAAAGDRDAALAAAHFLAKGKKIIAEKAAGYPMGTILAVLARLDHLQEAIELAREFEMTPGLGKCYSPTIYELCQLAGDYEGLAEWARGRGDLVGFAAGLLQKGAGNGDGER